MGSSGAGGSAAPNTDAFFIPLLDRELRKICMFYEMEEQRVMDDVAALQQEVERQEESGPYAGHQYLDDDGDEDDEEDDDFEVHSPGVSRDRNESPARRRRRHSRSLSSAAPALPSGMSSINPFGSARQAPAEEDSCLRFTEHR